MGQLARRRFMRTMRTGPGDFPTGATGGGGQGGQQQQQQGGQQGAGGGGPPNGQQAGNPGGGQNNGTGQQGGQGNQGGQQQQGSLLDGMRGQGGQQQGAGDQGQQQGGQGGGFTQEQLAAIGGVVQSVVDRHVNTLNNPGGGRNNGGGRNQGGQGNNGGQGNGNDGGQQVHSVDVGQRREARLAFREYVGDRVKFLSDVERNVAVRMGTAAIATWDGRGDADQYGAQVAQEVATAIQELGRMYERMTTQALEKAGRLKPAQQQGTGAGSSLAGVPLPAGGSTGIPVLGAVAAAGGQRNPQQAMNNAVALADRYNQQAGYQPAQQQTT